jgi:predicted metalloprotease with PDZ domain
MKPEDAKGFGALEHPTATTVVLPEMMPLNELQKSMIDVVSHEFFHIVTPLTIHSNEIQYFDYNAPKMSQHLWMYEGVTEYFANLVQVRDTLLSVAQFVSAMKQKLNESDMYKNMSMTDMSKSVLTTEGQEQYLSVYSKGALIAFCLDIKMQELSGGKNSLRDVMMNLAKMYGPLKPFKDADLINNIVSFSDPSIRQFYEKYVIGKEDIPYGDYFAKLGINYEENVAAKRYVFGAYSFDSHAMKFMNVGDNVLHVMTGDELVSVNGNKVDGGNLEQIFTDYFFMNTKYVHLTLQVMRNGSLVTLDGDCVSRPYTIKKLVELMEKPTDAQLALRKSVLGKAE